VFDTAANKITSWSIGVSGGNVGVFPPVTYTTANSISFVPTTGDLGLRLPLSTS
jgi:hypothetical protein